MKNDILIQLRKTSGQTQEEVAKQIGISRSMYAMIEIGERTGRYPTLKKIANYFGKTVDEVFGAYFFTVDAHEVRQNDGVYKSTGTDRRS